MLERWKQAIDKGEYISVMYMDLSKAFGTINYDLLLENWEPMVFQQEL